jgi:hypothetical protein
MAFAYTRTPCVHGKRVSCSSCECIVQGQRRLQMQNPQKRLEMTIRHVTRIAANSGDKHPQ